MTATLDDPARAQTARSADSRARQIAAAAPLFASRGYSGVTVRELAKAADVNVAAISYHFGGKRGLYLAALERLMEEMRPVGGPVIQLIDDAFADGAPDRGTLAEIADAVVRHILTTMLSGGVPPWVTQTVLREFQEPTPDYRPMFDERVLPLHRAIRRLTSAALGLDPEGRDAVLASHAAMGQVMVFAAARSVILEELDLRDFGPDDVERVIVMASRLFRNAIALDRDGESA